MSMSSPDRQERFEKKPHSGLVMVATIAMGFVLGDMMTGTVGGNT